MVIPFLLLFSLFANEQKSKNCAFLYVLLTSILSTVYVIGLSRTWPNLYKPVQSATIVIFSFLAYKDWLTKFHESSKKREFRA